VSGHDEQQPALQALCILALEEPRADVPEVSTVGGDLQRGADLHGVSRDRRKGVVWRMATKRRLSTRKRAPTRFQGGVIVAKAYPLLQEAIENGVKWGIRRVFKYRDKDTITENELVEEDKIDQILNCIMVEVCERFDFPEPGGQHEEEDGK
jgi:hypothetical protein